MAGRAHDRRLSIGEANPVELRVRWVGPARGSGGARRIWARDEAPPEIVPDRRVIAGALAPGGEWRATYHLNPVRRGEYAFGDLNVRVEGPARLLRRQLRLPLAEPALVYPNLRAVQRYELQVRSGRAAEAGLRRTRLAGGGTELERLREYVPDDEYRRIAWKATARRHAPIVVEHETERSQNVILAVDAGRLMAAPVRGMQKLDYAVNTALMVAYVATRLGDRAGLLAFADRVELFVPPARGRRQLQLLLSGLNRLRPQPVESDAGRALAFLAGRNARRSLVVLLTDLVQEEAAAGLVAHLALIGRRHLVLCVAIGDPDLAEMAAGDPTDLGRAYEQVVARRLLDERHGLVERLARRGTPTLDVPADRLTAETVDRYLRIKARTQL